MAGMLRALGFSEAWCEYCLSREAGGHCGPVSRAASAELGRAGMVSCTSLVSLVWPESRHMQW